MKNISKGCWIVSALLLVWAIMDFRSWAVIGKDLAAYYSGESIILNLARNNLFQGIVKTLSAFAILAAGRIRAERKKQTDSLTAVIWLLIFALFTVWGTGMYCLTSVTAEYAAARYLKDYDDFASVITSRSLEPWLGKSHSSRYALQYILLLLR